MIIDFVSVSEDIKDNLEIQKFPKAKETVKYLVKDGRYDCIETGSMLSIKKKSQEIIIPSKED